MKIKDQEVILKGTAGNVKIQRMPDGFPRIESDEEIDLHYGLGYIHGHDRQMHMWFLKIIGRGKASELLKADQELIELDKFMRWIDLGGEELHTNNAGGPSDRRFSKYYKTGLTEWMSARYHVYKP